MLFTLRWAVAAYERRFSRLLDILGPNDEFIKGDGAATVLICSNPFLIHVAAYIETPIYQNLSCIDKFCLWKLKIIVWIDQIEEEPQFIIVGQML